MFLIPNSYSSSPKLWENQNFLIDPPKSSNGYNSDMQEINSCDYLILLNSSHFHSVGILNHLHHKISFKITQYFY